MESTITYEEAVERLGPAIDNFDGLNAFQVSSILALLFGKEKEKTLNDIIQIRGRRK